MIPGLTEAQTQQMLIDELVLTDDAAILSRINSLVPSWFTYYGSKSAELQYWYVRRSLLMFIQAQYRFFVDTTTGPDKIAANQVFKNATLMLNFADDNINKLDTTRGVAMLGSIDVKGSLPDSLEEVLNELQSFAVIPVDITEVGGIL